MFKTACKQLLAIKTYLLPWLNSHSKAFPSVITDQISNLKI